MLSRAHSGYKRYRYTTGMESSVLIELVHNNFGLGAPTSSDHLVKFDGFDELDKKHALEIFLGRTSDDIARALADDLLGTQSDVEDLFVMEPAGYQYYLAPYLMRIIQNEKDESEDLQLAGFVIFNIREIVRVRGVEAFSKSQRAALSEIGKYLTEQCKQKNREDIWAEPLLNDLEFLVARFLDD